MGRRAGPRGEGAEAPGVGVLEADRETRAAGGRGWRTLRAGPGVRRGGKELAQAQGTDRLRDTHARLTLAGPGRHSPGSSGGGGARGGPLSRVPGLPPSGRPAGAGPAEAAATPEPRTAGRRGRSCTNRLRAPRLGSAALGGARLRSTPLGSAGGVARGPPPRSPLAPWGRGFRAGSSPLTSRGADLAPGACADDCPSLPLVEAGGGGEAEDLGRMLLPWRFPAFVLHILALLEDHLREAVPGFAVKGM